jgi:hypothetical protein
MIRPGPFMSDTTLDSELTREILLAGTPHACSAALAAIGLVSHREAFAVVASPFIF